MMSGWRSESSSDAPKARVETESDEWGMTQALAQGELAAGRTSPNPGVGCVVLGRNGAVVGRGFTDSQPGGPHAEVVALREAGGRAQGGTLYVTLEPCSHWGRTPPCADAVIASGVSKVVAALEDPDERVKGEGFRRLKAAGVEVIVGVGAPHAARQMEGYLKFKRSRFPFALLKMAMTLDGKIATRTGDSRWVSSAGARRLVQELRDGMDAVMVGIGTALADDPALTVRPEELPSTHPRAPRSPVRVVVDSRARMPTGARMLKLPGRTIVITSAQAEAGACQALEKAGAEVAVVAEKDGRVDLRAAMLYLGQQHVYSVMIEGGAELAAGVLSSRLVDRLLVFVAPKIVGDRAAPGPIGGVGPTLMKDALSTGRLRVREINPDIAIETDLANEARPGDPEPEPAPFEPGGSEDG